MKKLLFILLALVLVQGVFATGSGENASQKTFKLKWSGMMTDTHAWTIAEKAICEEVTKRTNGRITMQAYPNGSLGSQQEGIEMLRTGDLAFLTSGPSIFGSYIPQTQIFTFPYMFKDRDQIRRAIASPVIQKMFNEDILKMTGVRTVAWWYYGSRELTTKNTPARKPEDLAGLKIRCVDTPAAKDVVLALGGNPTPVAFTELYFALQTGVVDGQENPVTTIFDKKFNEVQKYLIMTHHNLHMGTVHVSEKIWQQFSDKDRKMFMELFDTWTKKVDELIDTQTKENLAVMVKGGLQVIDPDEQAFRAHAVAHINKVYGTDPKWAEVLKAVQAIK